MSMCKTVSIVILFLLLVPTAPVRADQVWPLPEWRKAKPSEVGMDDAQLRRARDYALTGGGAGYITRHGKLVMTWGDPAVRYDLKSTTKSIGVTALGLAIADGKIRLQDKVVQHHPTFAVPPESNEKTRWIDSITIQHLATQTAGFEKPGGYTKLIFKPGTKWSWGLYESLIVVIPSLDIVVARAGKSWQRKWDGHYDVLRPFFEPIVASASE